MVSRLLGWVKDAFEEEFFESSRIEIGFDDRTFVDDIAILDRLVLPLQDFTNIESGTARTFRGSARANEYRLTSGECRLDQCTEGHVHLFHSSLRFPCK